MGYKKSFIEVQFPVSKISKESYKERMSGSNQTLTGLGKWWGRKPLILVRAIILSLLMPSTNNPKKDKEIFLKILTMDNYGLSLRKNKSISIKDIYSKCNEKEKEVYFEKSGGVYLTKYKKGLSVREKNELQNKIFSSLSYDEKIKYCNRPEEIRESDVEWEKINKHLGTQSKTIVELINELGIRMFGRIPKVGDCFSGGGSIPFEAGRIGCDVYASDLNPLAGLLTWSDLNLINKSDIQVNELKKYQEKVYDIVVKQFNEWGIEDNEKGWKAKYYLYCHETICPECGCIVPLSPNWIISDSYKTIAQLQYNSLGNNFDIKIIQNASKDEMNLAKEKATVKKGYLVCPKCNKSTPISSIRKDKKGPNGKIEYGLRKWKQNEYIANENDIFKERLYCIKYIEKFKHKTWEEVMKKPASATDSCYGEVHYISPTEEDNRRELKVLEIIKSNFNEWQEFGYIPSMPIEGGEKTDEPKRTRGWMYWHQLFNPRQLLEIGLIMKTIHELAKTQEEKSISILAINKIADFNSKLSNWAVNRDIGANTFYNQALNTLYNYAVRGLSSLYTLWIFNLNNNEFECNKKIKICDARSVDEICDLWITDPPYADAINYHELSEFFLALDKKMIEKTFPKWYSDSKRVLAVKGTGADFNNSMVEVYSNLAEHMSDNGLQVVMFTHQDVKVWAELAMILWSSGLQVTAAWNIATETESGGLKDGNYVKGTVLLVLRKQKSNEIAYLDELYPEIEEEVKNQIDSMRELDDKEDPNFSDPDYLLAAYAASLKVLTSYKSIEDIDVKYELSKNRNEKGETPIQKIINEAKKIAYDYLIPAGFDNYLWKELKSVERFYLKGLEFEMNNMCKLSGYQELAKGFGVNEYNWMLGSTKANSARVKTPKEFAMRNINDNSVFGQSLLRHVLASIYIALKEEDINKGLNWLKTEVNDYWNNRNMLVEILNYLSKVEVIDSMEHWKECAHEAFILKNLVENDSI